MLTVSKPTSRTLSRSLAITLRRGRMSASHSFSSRSVSSLAYQLLGEAVIPLVKAGMDDFVGRELRIVRKPRPQQVTLAFGQLLLTQDERIGQLLLPVQVQEGTQRQV